MPKKSTTSSAGLNRRTLLAGTASLLAAPMVVRPAFAQGKTVNVGVIMPLSGANAQFGINSRNGVELVADEINAAGGIKALGGAKINLIVADATSTPTTAGTVAQRLITQNDVTAILSPLTTSGGFCPLRSWPAHQFAIRSRTSSGSSRPAAP